MVDALRSAHRAVRRGGIVIDARPDASRLPRIIAAGRVRTTLVQTEDADDRDGRADDAVETVIRRGLFRPLEDGYVWHVTAMGDLAALDDYVDENARYARYERGGRARLAPFREGPLDMRRAIKFQVLERL
jgi:hypothetical protein